MQAEEQMAEANANEVAASNVGMQGPTFLSFPVDF